MPYEILMPRLGWNMEEGTLIEWLKQDGDPVQSGDLVCTIEGDKATMEIESFETGTLRIPHASPALGTTIAVGTLLGYIVPEEERDTFDPDASPNADTPSSDSQTEDAPDQTVAILGAEASSSLQKDERESPISPRARRVAKELDVDWRSIQGSGRSGRIVEADIRKAAEQQAPSDLAGHKAIPLQGIRQVIAERMTEATRTTAPVTLTTEVDATVLATVRAQWPEDQSVRPAYHDLLIKIVGTALDEHPALNTSWHDDHIIAHEHINIGLAVDTDRGLTVPVISNVPGKSIQEISSESSHLIQAAQSDSLSLTQLQDGTFTITNLGMYDIDAFTPILNLPQCAILGVGRTIPKVTVIDEGNATTGIRKMMALSLTFDHRLVDGAPAARFLQRIKQLIETPGDVN